MELFIILLSVIAANAGTIKEDGIITEDRTIKECDGVLINGVYHDTEILHEGLDRPYLLAVDYSTNILYFSYSVQNPEDDFKTARLNLNTKDFADIKGINNGFAQTVDQKNHEVYIGGSNGIYKYDYGQDKADFIAERDVDIWNIYFKDVLYFSVYPTQFMFTYSEGETTRFKDLEDTKVDNFVINNDDVIYFTNATGLYSQPKGTKNTVLCKEYPTIGVRALTTDINGEVYLCLQDGIYAVNKNPVSVEKLVDIEDAFGIAFDIDNNIVYADGTKLVRLKPNKKKSC